MTLLYARCRILVVAAIVGAGQSVGAQQLQTPHTGSLCVLPHVKKADAITQSPEVPPAAEKYTLRLDDSKWITLSPESSVLLAGIPSDSRHKVVIRGDGKPFSAFTFTFQELRATDLCLSQSGLYLVWRFHPSADRYAPCRCRGIAPAAWTATSPNKT